MGKGLFIYTNLRTPFLGQVAVVLVIILFGTAPSHAQREAPKLELSDIVEGLRRRERVIQTASVHVRIERLQRVGIRPDAPLAPTKLVLDATWDLAGRVRYNVLGQMAGKRSGDYYILDYREAGAFDGATSNRMRGEGENRKFLQGTVDGGRTVAWPVDPRFFDTHWYEKPVSAQFGRGTPSIVGYADFHGRRVVLCQVELKQEDGFKHPGLRRFWIDVERGFVVVRKEASSKPPASTEWFLYGLTESTDYFEASPGIWLPRRGVKEHYIDATKGQPRLWEKLEVELSDWRVNQDLPQDAFTLEFAPNIFVTDNRTGKRYQASAIDEAHLQAQTARAQQLAMELEDMASSEEIESRLSPEKGSATWPLYLLVLGAGLCLAATGLWARRYWNRKTRAA